MGKISCKILIFSVPFILLYIIMDPFKTLRDYEIYYDDSPVGINRSFVSTQTYLNKDKKYHYDSFILGSSRTLGFLTGDWKPFLHAQSSPFVLTSDMETISGIYDKIIFLDKRNSPINNALIILSNDVIFVNKETEHHLLADHPLVSGQSRLHFKYLSFVAFFSRGFFLNLLDFYLFNNYRNYLQDRTLSLKNSVVVDPVTNDLRLSHLDSLIERSPDYHNMKFGSGLYRRNGLRWISHPQINQSHRRQLDGIMEIFKKRRTSYKIVIDPLYNQQEVNPGDLTILRAVFGSENVFDFSGINAFTEDVHNYYEISHYRPSVGKKIMELIYKNDVIPVSGAF